MLGDYNVLDSLLHLRESKESIHRKEEQLRPSFSLSREPVRGTAGPGEMLAEIFEKTICLIAVLASNRRVINRRSRFGSIQNG